MLEITLTPQNRRLFSNLRIKGYLSVCNIPHSANYISQLHWPHYHDDHIIILTHRDRLCSSFIILPIITVWKSHSFETSKHFLWCLHLRLVQMCLAETLQHINHIKWKVKGLQTVCVMSLQFLLFVPVTTPCTIQQPTTWINGTKWITWPGFSTMTDQSEISSMRPMVGHKVRLYF